MPNYSVVTARTQGEVPLGTGWTWYDFRPPPGWYTDFDGCIQKYMTDAIGMRVYLEVIYDPAGANRDLTPWLDVRSGVSVDQGCSLGPGGPSGQYRVGEIKLRFQVREPDQFVASLEGWSPDVIKRVYLRLRLHGCSQRIPMGVWVLGAVESGEGYVDLFLLSKLVEPLERGVTANSAYVLGRPNGRLYSSLSYGRIGSSDGALDLAQVYVYGKTPQVGGNYDKDGATPNDPNTTDPCQLGQWELEISDVVGGVASFTVHGPSYGDDDQEGTTDADFYATSTDLTGLGTVANAGNSMLCIPAGAWSGTFDVGDILTFSTTRIYQQTNPILAMWELLTSDSGVPQSELDCSPGFPGTGTYQGPFLFGGPVLLTFDTWSPVQMPDMDPTKSWDWAYFVADEYQPYFSICWHENLSVLKAIEDVGHHCEMVLTPDGSGKYAVVVIRPINPNRDYVPVITDEDAVISVESDRLEPAASGVKATYFYDYLSGGGFQRSCFSGREYADYGIAHAPLEIELPGFWHRGMAQSIVDRAFKKFGAGLLRTVRVTIDMRAVGMRPGCMLRVITRQPKFDSTVMFYDIKKDISKGIVEMTGVDIERLAGDKWLWWDKVGAEAYKSRWDTDRLYY